MGEEKCSEIEADVNLFADADQFRIYHAKGRFRGTLCTLLVAPAICTTLNGGSNGIGWMAKNKALAGLIVAGTWSVFYQLWSR